MTEYADDAPHIRNDTSCTELVQYATERVSNPIMIGDTCIYHFASHKPDMEALEAAVRGKLKRNVYIVPLQVYSGWTFILPILPEPLRQAEILVYREDEEAYYAYKNFMRELKDPLKTQAEIEYEFWNNCPLEPNKVLLP